MRDEIMSDHADVPLRAASSERLRTVVARPSIASERYCQAHHLRVLLVDDNPGMLARAEAALAPRCDIVAAVNDGTAALHAAAALHPDVVVLDISMPGMSGLDVASYLRKAGSSASVVFLTVHDEEDFVAAAKNAGALGYVLKSRLTVDLMKAVEEAGAGHPFVSPRL